MKDTDENKIHTDEKEKHTKTKITICIIIIIIIILLLLTSCTSGFWGKIGSVVGNSTYVIDPSKPSDKELINKDLRFDVAKNSITLDESAYKLTYSTKNILANDVTCTTSDADIATCVAYDGYVVVNPKKAGSVTVYATTKTNGIVYKATSELTITDGNNGIRLSSRNGTIVLSKSNTKNVAYNLIGIKGKVNVSVDNKDVVSATASDGVLKIKGLKPGNAVITLNVEYAGKSYTTDYRVSVVKDSTSTATKPSTTKKPTTTLAPLKLSVTSKELKVKEKFQIDVLSGAAKSWKSSSTSIATVSKNGLVTAKKVGTVTITATDKKGNKATVIIYVTDSIQNSNLVLSETYKDLKVGETFTPAVIKGTVSSWSTSDKSIATVDKNGKIVAKKPGTVTITAKDKKGNKATIIVKVTEATKPVNPTNPSNPTNPTSPIKDSIILEGANTTKTLDVGKSENLKVKQGTAIRWESSNPNIVSVDQSGKITAISPGAVVITATDAEGNKSSITINVPNPSTPPKDSIILEGANTTKTLDVGKSETLKVKQGTAVRWESSNPNIVSVDQSGKITAISAGAVVITATDAEGNKSSITINVPKPTTPPKDSIILEEANTTKTLDVGESETLKVKQGTAVRWESSNPNIVSVDSNGKITAISAGTVVITAFDAEGNSSSLTVTANDLNPSIDNLELSTYSVELYISNTFSIRVVKGQAVAWVSSNTNVVTVDQKGNIVGKAEGTATITATGVNGEKRTVTIKVKKNEGPVNPNDKVKLEDEGTTKQITVGNKVTLGVLQGTPSKWESSNSDIVSVDNDGNITGKKPGKATITVTDKDGNTSSVTIEVRAKTIELSETVINLIVGDKETVSVINNSGPVKEWRVDDASKGIVDVDPKTGEITARKEGQAKVYAVNESGEPTLLIVNVSKSNRLASLKVDASGDVLINDSGNAIRPSYVRNIDSADKNQVTIIAEVEDKKSTLEYIYDGISTASDNGYIVNVTKGGEYVVTIKVTAQNGVERFYTVTINKPKSNNTGITLKNGNDVLTPGDTNIVKYNAEKIALSYVLDDPRSEVTKVTINGVETDLDNVILSSDDKKINELVVTVTAEDGSTTDYVYKFRRASLSLDLEGNDNFTFNINDGSYKFEYQIYEEGNPYPITANVDEDQIGISVLDSTFKGSIEVTDRGIIKVIPKMEDVGTHKVTVSYKGVSKEIDLIVRDHDYYLSSPNNKYDALFVEGKNLTTSVAISTDILQYNEKGPLYGEPIEDNEGFTIKSKTGDKGELVFTYDKSRADIKFVKNTDPSDSYILQITPKNPAVGDTTFDIQISGSIHGKPVDDLTITINVIPKYILTLDARDPNDDNKGYLDSLRNQTYTVLLERGEKFDLTGYKPYKVADEDKCEVYVFKSWMLGDAEYNDSDGNPIQIVEIVDSNITLTVKYSSESQIEEITTTGYFDLQDLDLFNSINNQYDVKKLIYPGLEGGHGITVENSSDSDIIVTKLIIQEQNLCVEPRRCLNMGYAIRRNVPDSVNNVYYYRDRNTEHDPYAILNQDKSVVPSTAESDVVNYYDPDSSITHIEILVDDPEFIIPAHGAVELGVLWKWVEEDHELDTQIGELANVNNQYKFWLSLEYEVTDPYCKLNNKPVNKTSN